MTESISNITMTTSDLTVGYKKGKDEVVILKSLNLTASKGELICFMGPNGVGKSTLLRTICGLQPALNGDIELVGTKVNHLSASQMAKTVSLVLTDRINAGNLSSYELVALGRYPYLGWNVRQSEEDESKIRKAIDQTNIVSFIDKKIYELSDGQMQKVMIARALAQDTPLMILDEPTAHLDLNNRVEVVNLLKDLARNTGKTIVMATHELDLALQTADKLWLAGFNQPIKTGFPEDLVLNGDIDRVFELKGYDLKTGILKKKSLGYNVQLSGNGHPYLWTKNALERNGFELSDRAKYQVVIKESAEGLYWQINNENSMYKSLAELTQRLIQLY